LTFADGANVPADTAPTFRSDLAVKKSIWTAVQSEGRTTATAISDGTVVTLRQPQIRKGSYGILPTDDDKTASIKLMEEIYSDDKTIGGATRVIPFPYTQPGNEKTVQMIGVQGGSTKSGNYYLTLVRLFNKTGYAAIIDITSTTEAGRDTAFTLVLNGTYINRT